MTPRGFPTSLLYIAMIVTLHCKADRCPPPTGLSYEWLDEFTLKLSWKKPKDLQDNNEIKFRLVEHNINDVVCLPGTDYTTFLLTEDVGSDWMYSIWTNCSQLASKDNIPANITIKPRKPRAKVVNDFKCFADTNQCSWIPVNPSLNLTLSYRMEGKLEESINSLKQCDHPYSEGERNGCELNIDTTIDNIRILVETKAGMSTFKPVLVLHPPKLNITEEGDSLTVNLTPPKVGRTSCWQYDVCYKQCSNNETCQNTGSGEHTMTVPYDKHCLYEFKARVRADAEYCLDMSSDWSETVTYGINKPPDRTLTVVAIVIPIILSICVILSCYCFRRHSDIICPTIPDPSTIFKEMMMNGPRELQNGGNLYKPVQECSEPCKVILVPENSIIQQNS